VSQAVGVVKQTGQCTVARNTLFDPLVPVIPFPLQCTEHARKRAKYKWFSSKLVPLGMLDCIVVLEFALVGEME
jgi:hypothetical protein